MPETCTLFAALTRYCLKMLIALLGQHGSNLARDRPYDRKLHDATHVKSFTNHAGILDFYAGNHRPLFPGKPLRHSSRTSRATTCRGGSR